MRDGKLCPEERWPTEILLPSSWLPTGSCDRDSVKICPMGSKNFSVSAPSMFDTFFSEDWNYEAAYKLVMCLALCGQCQRVTFVATCNKVRQFPVGKIVLVVAVFVILCVS